MNWNHPAFRVFVITVLLGTWLVFGYFPVKEKQARLAGKEAELEGRLARLRRLAPQIPLWQTRQTELEKSVGDLIQSLHTPDEARSFLAEVMEVSRKEGLKVLNAQPDFFELLSAVRDMDSNRLNLIRPVSFSIKLEGSYSALAGAAQKIEVLPAYRGFILTEAVKGSAPGKVEATLVFYAYLIINPGAET